MQQLVIASDHRGFVHKQQIIEHFAHDTAIQCVDMGTTSTERTDYPIYARKALTYFMEHKDELLGTILLCGSGAGMAIMANRIPHVYAAVAWNATVAREVKEDDNCNVLVIPSDFIDSNELMAIVTAWLQARFKEGVYGERLAMIDK